MFCGGLLDGDVDDGLGGGARVGDGIILLDDGVLFARIVICFFFFRHNTTIELNFLFGAKWKY